MPKNLIKRPQVQAITALCRSSIYRLIAENKFPKPIKTGTRSVAWIEAEVIAWVENKIEQSRSLDNK